MIQVYPFHGTEFSEVYDKLNCFLGEMAIIDVQVEPENVRSNTKYYPDWDRTATTIEVCIDFEGSPAPHEIASQIHDLHLAVVNRKPEPTQDEEPAQNTDEGLKLGKGHRLELSQDTDGWLLVDCHEDQRQVAFRDVQSGVLDSVRHYLQRDPGNDFDPFLDADDMP